MTDTATTDTTTTDTAAQSGDQTADTAAGTDLTAEVEKWKAAARKHEDRAKANAKAVTELEQLRQQTMTDTERAIETAKAEARQSVLGEVGGKIAAAEIRAAAAGRMAPEQLDTLVAGLNLGSFVGDDGEVDRDKVSAFIEGIAPKQEPQASTGFDLGQGARGGNDLALNGDPLLRDLKSKLGIR